MSKKNTYARRPGPRRTSGKQVSTPNIVDPSDWKPTGEDLRRCQERLNQVMQIANLGIWDWDIPTDRVAWEGAMFSIYGVSPAEFSGNGSEYVNFTRPDYRETQVKNIQKELEHGISEAEFLSGARHPYTLKELCIVRPDGSECFTLGDAVCILDAEGKPARMLGVTIDVTALKRAEQTLRESEALLKKSQAIAHVGHWTWDTVSNQLKWSDEMYRIFGYEPGAAPSDLDAVVAHSIHPDDREKVRLANEAVIHAHKPVPMDYRVIWPDGSVHVVWAQPSEKVTDENGNILLLMGIVQDITQRKLAEDKLNEQLDELRRWHAVTLGREKRILELKNEVNQALLQAGLPPRYASAQESSS